LKQKPALVNNYDDVVHDVKRELQECYILARENVTQTKQRKTS